MIDASGSQDPDTDDQSHLQFIFLCGAHHNTTFYSLDEFTQLPLVQFNKSNTVNGSKTEYFTVCSLEYFVFFSRYEHFKINSRGPNFRIRDNFFRTMNFFRKFDVFRVNFAKAVRWKIFLWTKDWRYWQNCKGKKRVKNWGFLKVVFNGNDWYHWIEREILSKKYTTRSLVLKHTR